MVDDKLLPKLSQNLLEILNDEEYYDITIEVGNDPYAKIFRSHMVILYYRSPYLKRILSTNKKKNDGTLAHIKLPNILPETFQIILMYIYSGRLSLEKYDNSDVIKILVTASELGLQELITYLQSFLIENKANWMEQNFNLIYQTSFENNSFLELQQYCTNLISKEPDKIFKSSNLSSISEKLLVSIIQSDNLQMNEIKVWENVLKWGLAQNPELPSDPTSFSEDDFNILKNSLQQCVPFIRFCNLTSKEFSDKVLPYRKILPEKLFEDLLKYFLDPNSQSIKKSKPRKLGRDEEKFESYKVAAEKGDLDAQFQLGCCYDEGIGTEVNKPKAFELYESSAKKGSLDAQYNLISLYQLGEGIDKNEKKAFELMKNLAEKKYLRAQFKLGYYYSHGIGTDMNKSKAFESYKIVAEENNASAQNNLGVLYETGKGVEKDFKKAFYWFNKAAENGLSVAQYNLGGCYELGNGIDKDLVKAFECYKKSAENGFIDAKFQLGYCYVNGIGTDINKEKGFKLYNEAAGKEINPNKYENDEEIDNDLDKVNYWYHKAAENVNKALYKLGEIYELGKGVRKDEVRAFMFYMQAAKKEDINGKYKLGYCYENGIGTYVDIKKAIDFYKMAAEKENSDAQKSLALLYKQGKGIEKNLDKATYWYKKAIENGCQDAEIIKYVL